MQANKNPSDMVETTPRLGFIELNVAAEIFASERDLLGATYKGMTLLDLAMQRESSTRHSACAAWSVATAIVGRAPS